MQRLLQHATLLLHVQTAAKPIVITDKHKLQYSVTNGCIILVVALAIKPIFFEVLVYVHTTVYWIMHVSID
jgi:hypothetical protein